MKDYRLLPDDPNLTAYALGELTGNERALVEAALRENPALRLVVDEIRSTAAQLEAALAAEPMPSRVSEKVTTPGVRIELNGHAIDLGRTSELPRRSAVNGAKQPRDEYPLANSREQRERFPRVYFLVPTLAAACFAVMVVLYEPAPKLPMPEPANRIVRREVALPEPRKPDEAMAASAENAPAVTLPKVALNVGADTSSSTQDAAAQTAGATVFIDGNLSLLGQRPAGAEVKPPAVPRNEAAAVATSAVTRVGESVRPITPGPLVSFEMVPVPSAPIVASTTSPSVIPNSIANSVAGSATGPGTGDVVMLSAFTVSAEPIYGFAGVSQNSSASSDRRKNAGHDDRPSPPPGAKFGRKAEAYSYVRDNDFLPARDYRTSTFSLEVDTASYANVRRIIEQGTPPPPDAVRIEELLNYFPYRYAAPKGDLPIVVSLEVAQAPWAPKHRLVRIGLKAREVTTAQRPAANLVFLLDVSGSMNEPNKLPLVKQAMRLLVGKLRADDRVAIVTYAGNSGLALPSTPVAQAREILNALDALAPGGATNGAMGIQLAYEIARANFAPQGINRVILCTDGDFNVGASSEADLVRLIAEKATSGVSLTVLGFGMGNYKDATLEKLATTGNGNYGYIDTRREAEKLLVEQVSGTLVTVAKDVKLQVEFNPALVARYRLIGYENPMLRREDFRKDRVAAGEIGANHTVTALYEIVPVGVEENRNRVEPPLDELKYLERGDGNSRFELPGRRDAFGNELLTVSVHFRKPDSWFSFGRTLEFVLNDAATPFARASADFRFAAAVAEFGMILRGSPHRGKATMRDVGMWAAAAAMPDDDPGGYRGEFLDLVRKAQAMME